MLSTDQFDEEHLRVRFVMIGMLSAFLFLVAVLWQIQVYGASDYKKDIKIQSLRRVRIPGLRGAVYDRNGVCLADNRPSYCVSLYTEELRQPGRSTNTVNKIEEVIGELSELLGIEQEVTRDDISRHIRISRPLPFAAWRDVDAEVIAKLSESEKQFSGVVIEARPVRVYPHGDLACHLLGYVGRRDDKQDAEEAYRFFIPEMEGKYGVEKVFNHRLIGKPGMSMICVDASGFRYEEVEADRVIPEAGNNVVLTIDSRIQAVAEETIKGELGAAIVMDPRNGDVLALASAPTFDPSRIKYVKYWKKVNSDAKRKPMSNRVISGVYPAGSIFKPIVAIAALENKAADVATVFDCPGYYQLGNARFHCWNKNPGHGWLSVRKALEQSCNPYFCQLGVQIGHERIYRMAEALGFGQRTGIELVDLRKREAEGFLGSNSWKERKLNDKWRAGDTCNVSIGQGYLSVTPIQMAMVVSAIANKGRIYKPNIISGDDGSEGHLICDMEWSDETMRIVRGGMKDVVHSNQGTGKRARIEGVTMAGKTGTAQYGVRGEKQHTWMVAFAPYEEPRYAVVILVENGISGGVTVAPRIKKLMESVLTLDGTIDRSES